MARGRAVAAGPAAATLAAVAVIGGATAAVPIFPAEWALLGPFMGGGRGEADPAAAWLGASGPGGPPAGLLDALATNATFPSELAEISGGRVGWTLAPADASGAVTSGLLPQATWDELQGQYGQVGASCQGWAVGRVDAVEDGRYLAQCTGTREFWVRGLGGATEAGGGGGDASGAWTRVHGNQYGDPFTFLKGPVDLQLGGAQFVVRYMGAAGASFACGLEPWGGQALEFVGNDPLLPDLVDGTLAGTLASVVARNNDPSEFLTVVSATVKLAEGEPSWLSGTLSAGTGGLHLAPGQSRPVDLEFVQSAPSPNCTAGAAHQSLTVALEYRAPEVSASPAATAASRGGDSLVAEVDVSLICANFSQDPYKFTFRDFDGSVQFASLIPPSGPCGHQPCSVLLATHGASVDAGSPFWTKAYRRQRAAWVLLPTNKRGFGYDWQGAGLRNAQHSMQAAFAIGRRVPGVPPSLDAGEWLSDPGRVLYSGHSMGGHGCLIMSTHFPEGELASACTAGWIKSEMYPPQFLAPGFSLGDAHLNSVLMASISEYDTDFYLPNMLGRSNGRSEGVPMLVRMGSQDEDVPAFNLLRIARLRGQLEKNASYVEVSEVPGKPHWWDGAVDDDRMQAFYDQHLYADVPRPLEFSLRGVNPATLGSRGGLSLAQLEVLYRAASIHVSIDAQTGRWAIRTQNVRRLQFEPRLMQTFHPVSGVEVDGQWLDVGAVGAAAAAAAGAGAGDAVVTALCRARGDPGGGCTWQGDADSTWRSRERTPEQYGPAGAVFEGPVTVVYGEADWTRAAAVHLANDLYSQGRYSVDVVAHSDAQDLLAPEAATNLVIIGEQGTNSVLDALSSQWEAGSLVGHDVAGGALRLGGGDYEGPGLGIQYLAPLPARSGSSRLALVVSGTDASGTRAACGLFMGYQGYKSGMMVPDFMVVDQTFAWSGTGGVRAAGFWTNEWRASALTSYLSEGGVAGGAGGGAAGGDSSGNGGGGRAGSGREWAGLLAAFLLGALALSGAQWARQRKPARRRPSLAAEGVYERLVVPAEPAEMRLAGEA